MRTLAVLPVKSFGRAKQRLGDTVAAAERQGLAEAMACDVLEALRAVRGLDGVVVVSAVGAALVEEAGMTATAPAATPPAATPPAATPAVATPPAATPPAATPPAATPPTATPPAPTAPAATPAVAAPPDRIPPRPFVAVVDDPVERGQSAAALRGIRAAVAGGAARVLLVPGDCPALDPGEVAALLAGEGDGVTIVPDRHGSGTNALLIAPPEVLAPAFGPGSFARHAALARAAGATVRVAHLPSLELDVDTPEDLEALRSALAARPGGAARTRERLERLVPAPA
jgi:2-phospho-L-lactate guanylyltransferase